MSFDLQAFPPSGPRTVPDVRRLLAAEEQRLITGIGNPLPPFGREMTRFVDEMKQRWPSLEDDPDSPWSVSPDWQPTTGGGIDLAIVWSRADDMRTAILEIAAHANVIIYDRQVPEVILPPNPGSFSREPPGEARG
jgi:hypothetical protein